METGKLRIKDLVTIDVFTVIYFVLMFLSGMIGMVPILYLAYPTVSGIITSIVIMLFMPCRFFSAWRPLPRSCGPSRRPASGRKRESPSRKARRC